MDATPAYLVPDKFFLYFCSKRATGKRHMFEDILKNKLSKWMDKNVFKITPIKIIIYDMGNVYFLLLKILINQLILINLKLLTKF